MRKDEEIFRQPHQPLEVVFELDAPLVPMLETALEDVTLALSSMKIDRGGERWRITLILDGNQREEFDARYANLAKHFEIPEPSIAPLQMRDWVREVQQYFKPIRAGRFYIHGSHVEEAPPISSVPILLDAGAAFGTGEHETTKGCLLALDGLIRERCFSRVLDMGCGSGVLAIAAAKVLHAPVDATDIDAVSVQVARDNVLRNRVHDQVKLGGGAGYHAPLVRGEYDLILANILARPLMRMATDLRKHLAPGGIAVLSGLLNRQERMVLWAHREAGLRLKERIHVGPWSVLVLAG